MTPIRPAFPTWDARDRLGQISFPLASTSAPLQAADLLAHLTYLRINERIGERPVDEGNLSLLMACINNTHGKRQQIWIEEDGLRKMIRDAKSLSPRWDHKLS
jgi:hypothetical protein